jgi:hypothetical protein
MVLEIQNSQDFSYANPKILNTTTKNMASSFVSYAVPYNKTLMDWIFW